MLATFSIDFRGAIHSASGAYDEVKKKSIESIPPNLPEDEPVSDADYDDTPAKTPAERAVESSDYVSRPIRTEVIDGRPMTVVGPAEPPELELPDVQPVPIPDAPPMKPDVPPVLIPDAPPMKPSVPEQSIANVEPAQPATPPIGGPQSIMPMPDKAPQTVVIDGRPMTVVDPAQKPKGLLDIDTRNQITNELELDRSPASNKARINPNNFDLRRFDAVKIPQREQASGQQ